jgi:aquaporin Z
MPNLKVKNLVAELVGTAALVFFAVGVATLSFGKFNIDGSLTNLTGSSTSAGIVATALTFGLVLMALAYALGPISGCHVNPAVTIGFLVSKRISLTDAISYWVAQVIGGILGALLLWLVLSGSPGYSRTTTGLGTDGFGKNSMVHLDAASAFGAEVVLTFLFVLVVLLATSHAGTAGFAGLAIGVALTVVHLIGIALTGTSVNPARSIGPALIIGGSALSQLWVFIVAPLVGGVVAAGAFLFLKTPETPATIPPQPRRGR